MDPDVAVHGEGHAAVQDGRVQTVRLLQRVYSLFILIANIYLLASTQLSIFLSLQGDRVVFKAICMSSSVDSYISAKLVHAFDSEWSTL